MDSCVTCSDHENTYGLIVTAEGLRYSCWDSAGQPGMQIGRLGEAIDKKLLEENWVSCGYASHLTDEQREDFIYATLKGIFS